MGCYFDRSNKHRRDDQSHGRLRVPHPSSFTVSNGKRISRQSLSTPLSAPLQPKPVREHSRTGQVNFSPASSFPSYFVVRPPNLNGAERTRKRKKKKPGPLYQWCLLRKTQRQAPYCEERSSKNLMRPTPYKKIFSPPSHA